MENHDEIPVSPGPDIPPARPVPWTGLDVALLFLLWALTVSLSTRTMFEWAGISIAVPETENVTEREQSTTEHPITQFLRAGRESPAILWVAFFSAVLAAPVAEEFFYRLILQGWLEKAVAPLRKINPLFAVLFRPGVFSILFVSILFALAHGGARVERSVDFLFYAQLGVGIGFIAAVFLAAAYLLFLRGATLQDFGWKQEQLRNDASLAGLLFLIATPAVLGVNSIAKTCFPGTVTDPIPIFLLAVILGTLFYRTGRVFPCIVLHALFNGFNFLLAVFGSR